MNKIQANILLLSIATMGAACTPAGGLPSSAGIDNCFEQEAPSVCEWSTSSDVIVYGTVTAIEARPTPYAISTGAADDDLEKCGHLILAIDITLDVETESGSMMTGDGPLTFSVGSKQVGSWLPSPSFEGGELSWSEPDDQKIVVGQKLGAALTQEDRSFSTLGEPLFVQGPDGLRFQSQQETCMLGSPLSDSVNSVSSIDTLACEKSDGATRLDRKLQMREHATWRNMSACGDYSRPDAACLRDIDCNVGSSCSNGSCTQIVEEDAAAEQGRDDGSEPEPEEEAPEG